MSAKFQWIVAFAVAIAAVGYCQSKAEENRGRSELSDEHKSLIDKVVKEMQAGKKLTDKKVTHGGADTHGKILDLQPSGDVSSGDVTIEMETDLYAGQNSHRDVLFIQYVFVIDLSNGQLILKGADSILLEPGTGVCGLVQRQLNNLHSGEYRLIGRVSTRNSDGSETIRDEKTTTFRVP
jgi:hypothetical protein